MTTANKLLAKIARQNENERQAIREGSAEVGIWWYFNNELIFHSVPAEEGENIDGFINDPISHNSYWRSIIRRSPELRDYEYDQIPRGRIVKRVRDNQFYVFGPRYLMSKTVIRDLIKQSFMLPATTKFSQDDHYEDPNGNDYKNLEK